MIFLHVLLSVSLNHSDVASVIGKCRHTLVTMEVLGVLFVENIVCSDDTAWS